MSPLLLSKARFWSLMDPSRIRPSATKAPPGLPKPLVDMPLLRIQFTSRILTGLHFRLFHRGGSFAPQRSANAENIPFFLSSFLCSNSTFHLLFPPRATFFCHHSHCPALQCLSHDDKSKRYHQHPTKGKWFGLDGQFDFLSCMFQFSITTVYDIIAVYVHLSSPQRRAMNPFASPDALRAQLGASSCG